MGIKRKRCPKAPGNFRKYKWSQVFVLFLSVFFYGLALLSFYKIQKEPSISVFLSGTLPDEKQVNTILKTGRENTEDFSACFYWDGGLEKVQEPEYGRSAQVTVAGLYGDAALCDPRLNGFLETDREGCVLDAETARELFGTEEAEGRVLLLSETEYQVRKVLPWNQRIVVIRPDNSDNLCTRVFLPETGGSKSAAVQQFLLAYGLSGAETDSGVFTGCAVLSLCLLPAAAFICLLMSARHERRNYSEKEVGYWLWTAAMLLGVLAAAIVIWKKMEIPRDWIPSRWSDFSFWTERIQEAVERFRLFLLLPKTALQTQNLTACAETIIWAVGSVISCSTVLAGVFSTGENTWSEQ